MSVPASDPSVVALVQSAKVALRSALLAARRARMTDPLLPDALLSVPEILAASTIAAYAALPGEPDLEPALSLLRDEGKVVLLPLIQGDQDLEFRRFDGPLISGRLGIRVPPSEAPSVGLEEADVVIVPALAADRVGHRLGRGGGSYDRALRRVRPDALILAVVHAEELLAEVPVEPHDLPVGAVLAGATLIRVSR